LKTNTKVDRIKIKKSQKKTDAVFDIGLCEWEETFWPKKLFDRSIKIVPCDRFIIGGRDNRLCGACLRLDRTDG
jgi:hypothetical protein